MAGAVGLLFVVGAATASATPEAALRGGPTISAHVTGAKPGQACRIEAAGVDMPWRTVGADGSVVLDSGPVSRGRHDARVMCGGPGGAAAHAVGKQEDVFTGRWAPAYEFLHHHRLEFLTPREG